MRISAKGEYATRALIDLARHNGPGPIPLRDMAERQQVPQQYLVQVLSTLKSAGLVESRRGADGGYKLAKAPETISLGEVIRAVEGPILPLRCFDEPEQGAAIWPLRRESCAFWGQVRGRIADVLDETTLADMAQAFSDETPMYYI